MSERIVKTGGVVGLSAAALIIAFPLGDVANAVFSGSEGLLLTLLWGSIGAALLRRAAVPAAQSSVAPAHID